MASAHLRIREMVRTAVTENPGVKNRDLLDRAREIAPEAVEGMTLQQFHGTFRLPVSRALSGARPRAAAKPDSSPAPATGGRRRRSGRSQREALRDIFRRFAVQLSRAEGRAEIVRAAARIDEFVDEVVRTVGEPTGSDGTRARRPRRAAPQAAEGSAEGTAQPQSAVEGGSPAPPADAKARDMRRRRRPKAMLSAAAAASNPAPPAAAKSDAPVAPMNGAVRGADDVPDEPARPSTLGLSHDLEEFRRRRGERERGRRFLP